ncbi:RICIN domain-containing protein [Streptosporangium sp. NPDC048865]
MDATGQSSANGTRLQIWTCTGTANQKWNAPA